MHGEQGPSPRAAEEADITPSHQLEPDVVAGALTVLEEGRLFRYDADSPESSAASCFEREFAEYLGARYAVAVNSCSSALFLALLACGIRPGDEVLVPAFTFIAVPSAVVHAGGRPVLVEMNPELVLDPDDLEGKISDRTKALLLSYMRGRVPDLERVQEVCRRHGIPIIEDVAHGMGVEWDGVLLGRFGRAAAFSFQSHKLLDSGEGGALVTDDRTVALRALWQSGCYDRNWRWHFLDAQDHAWLAENTKTMPAYGLRMSNLAAAVLRPQLRRVPERLVRYEERYRRAVAVLDSSPIRILTQSPRVTAVSDSLQFEIPALGSHQLAYFVRRCNEQGVPLRVLGLDPSNSRCFWNWNFIDPQDCPRTRYLLSRMADLALPLWRSEQELLRHAEVIRTSLIEAGTARA